MTTKKKVDSWEEIQRKLEITRPRCEGCGEVGSPNHTLTKIRVVEYNILAYNPACFEKLFPDGV